MQNLSSAPAPHADPPQSFQSLHVSMLPSSPSRGQPSSASIDLNEDSGPATKEDVGSLTVAVDGLTREVRAMTQALINTPKPTSRNGRSTSGSAPGSRSRPHAQDVYAADSEGTLNPVRHTKPRQPRTLEHNELAVSTLIVCRLPRLIDRKSTRLNSSHSGESRMPSSA